jgi:hypothetical protein
LNCARRDWARGERSLQRHTVTLIALLLNGRSSPTDTPQPVYTLPSPPTQVKLIEGLSKAVSEEKLTAPFEISALRKTELGGFGSYFVCMREVNPLAGEALRLLRFL